MSASASASLGTCTKVHSRANLNASGSLKSSETRSLPLGSSWWTALPEDCPSMAGLNFHENTLYLIYLLSSLFLCGYFFDPLTQEARRHQVNKVKRILLKLPWVFIFSNLLPEFPPKSFMLTAILRTTQPHVRSYWVWAACGHSQSEPPWSLSLQSLLLIVYFELARQQNLSYSKLSCCHYLRCFDIVFQRRIFLKSLHIIFIIYIIMSETFITIDSLQHLEISR